MRGRNNRKGPNPLTRTYESNGPDVKIRGTVQHIAEKYLQLARDAQSSGDSIVAENYLQHAEHYFRIIAAAQVAQQQAQTGYGRGAEDFDETDEDDDFVALPDRFASPLERSPQPPASNNAQPNVPAGGFGQQPQPYFDRPAFAPEAQERNQERGQERGQDRNQERHHDRPGRGDRRFGQQGDRQQDHGRQRFRDQPPRPIPGPSLQEQPRVDFEPINPGLPAFITSPTRPSPAAPFAAPEPSAVDADSTEQPFMAAPPPEFPGGPNDGESENRFHLRPRRRRRPRMDNGGDGADDAPVAETNSAE
jgi:hypothetical protein